ncbi:hypothetical protein BH23PLA1_BH23PLA1_22690 [soil metagenome]
MTAAAQIALMVGPLAAYFAMQGLWQVGRRPRVVSGVVDYYLLAIGIGALLAYGPFGGLLLAAIFGELSIAARLAWLSFLTVLAMALAPPSRRRLLVYNIDPETLAPVLRQVLQEQSGNFARTLQGFEDRSSGQSLQIKGSRTFRTAEIEASGRAPEEVIRGLRDPLRERLQRRPPPGGRVVSWVVLFWIALAGLTLLVPISGTIFRPEVAHAGPTLRTFRFTP